MLDTLNIPALRRVGLSLAAMQQLQSFTPPPEPARLMRLVEVQRDLMLLADGEIEIPARALPALLRRLRDEDQSLAVGDWVLASEDAHRQWWIDARVPPATQIARRIHDDDGGLRRQVLVSNVDTALLLMGLDHDFNLRRLERYLALAHGAGVAPVLVLSKADAVPLRIAAERLAQAREVLPAQAAAFAVDGRSAEARRLLAPWLGEGQTLVLLGSSGAGKSTLTNTLAGVELQDTGAARAADSRGRHTTTVRTMRFTPEGACIIDTPGLRALRLDFAGQEDVRAAFDDIREHAGRCRFRDCRHEGEPGCAVREAVAPERLRNFQKLQREVRRDTMTLLERREQMQRWKQRGRETARVMAFKRGGG